MNNTLPDVQGVVLAAGKSSRFKRNKSKLTEKICGQEMILYATTLLDDLAIEATIVTGFQRQPLEKVIAARHGQMITFVHQEEQLGTGHAVLCALPTLTKEHILIINGDVPLVTKDIIEELYTEHSAKQASISFVAAHNIDPSIQSYGIVVEDEQGLRIVEARDAAPELLAEACLINAGIYLARRDFLIEAINQLKASSVTGELYLTDIVRMASVQGLTIGMTTAPFDIIRGVNTLKELWTAEHIKRSELIEFWMNQGIRFETVKGVHIDLGVTIGSGTSIGTGVQLYGKTSIGNNCTISTFVTIQDSVIDDHVIVKPHTIVKDSHLHEKSAVGPFANIHSRSSIGPEAQVGNFVEVCRSAIGAQTKVKHLAYLGDTLVGKRVNIGAGTTVCNYNGKVKNRTFIKDGAFIGSNNTLVAPVVIGEGAFTAAGSVITQDVPADALAIARARQINKPGYAHKLRDRESTPSYIAAVATPVEALENSEL